MKEFTRIFVIGVFTSLMLLITLTSENLAQSAFTGIVKDESLPDVGGSQAMQQTYFTVHGAGTSHTSVLMDGMMSTGLQGDAGIQSYLNDAGNEQMVYQTGGGTADSPTAGLKLNMLTVSVSL